LLHIFFQDKNILFQVKFAFKMTSNPYLQLLHCLIVLIFIIQRLRVKVLLFSTSTCQLLSQFIVLNLQLLYDLPKFRHMVRNIHYVLIDRGLYIFCSISIFKCVVSIIILKSSWGDIGDHDSLAIST